MLKDRQEIPEPIILRRANPQRKLKGMIKYGKDNNLEI